MNKGQYYKLKTKKRIYLVKKKKELLKRIQNYIEWCNEYDRWIDKNKLPFMTFREIFERIEKSEDIFEYDRWKRVLSEQTKFLVDNEERAKQFLTRIMEISGEKE